MKYRYAAAAAVAATGVSAQQPPAYTSPAVSSSPAAPLSYTTVTYSDCPSQSIETLITVTNGVTVTYCPECHTASATTKPPGPSHTTVYTTVYSSLCETGLVPHTYTITEECAEPTPTWASKSDHVPQGFTVTVKDCHVCDKTPVPVTITEPCKDGCGKPTPAPPAPTGAPAPKPSGDAPPPAPAGDKPAPGGDEPIKQIPDGQIQAPGPSGSAGTPPPTGGAGTPGAGSPDGGAQRPPAGVDTSCPGGANCPTPGGDKPSGDKPSGDKPSGDSPAGDKPAPGASASDGAAPPYPTPAGTDGAAHPSGDATHGKPSTIAEYEGAGAHTVSFGFASSICMAAVVAALAFAL